MYHGTHRVEVSGSAAARPCDACGLCAARTGRSHRVSEGRVRVLQQMLGGKRHRLMDTQRRRLAVKANPLRPPSSSRSAPSTPRTHWPDDFGCMQARSTIQRALGAHMWIWPCALSQQCRCPARPGSSGSRSVQKCTVAPAHGPELGPKVFSSAFERQRGILLAASEFENA